MYRDDTDAGSGFAVRDTDVSLTQVHVRLPQTEHLAAAHAGIEQYQGRVDARSISTRPKSVNFLPTKDAMRAYGPIPPE